ncbi:MAG TPA: ABC transporter substrate-binding protein [Streptosporangiaceae bacterium]|nr:ABC transporter substrate-binding protein [Streptosporangiaceae bacterium]
MIVTTALTAAACSSNGNGTGSTSTKGGTILGAGPFSPDTLDPDPQGIVDEQTNFMMAGDYAGVLLGVRPPSPTATAPLNFTDLVPELAASVKPEPSGTGYQFTLRKGVVSNWGNPLTSADVAWTFQRMVQTKAIGAILLSIGNVNTANPITVTGPLTFTLNLLRPSPVILDMLQITAMAILDKKAVQQHAAPSDPWGYKWLANHVASYGPYIVSSFSPSVETTLVPNPHYYGPKPAVTKVIFKQITDSSSRLQLLQGGEINLDWQASPTEYSSVKSNTRLRVNFDHAALFSRIVPNFRTGPFKNVLVRRAVQAAIDRQAIANAILPGQATPATSCVPSPINPSGFTGLSNATANVALAKKLLAQAGYKHGLTITLATNYGVTIADLPAVASFLQTQLSAAGITLKIQSYPTQASYLQAVTKAGYEALMDTFQPFVADPGFYMLAVLTAGAKNAINYGAYENKAFDADITTAMSTVGPSRTTALDEACGLAQQDVATIPLINIPTLTITSSNVTGVYDYPDLQLHFDVMKVSS